MPNWHTLGRVAYYAVWMGAAWVALQSYDKTGHWGFWLASIAFSGIAIVGFGRILLEITK